MSLDHLQILAESICIATVTVTGTVKHTDGHWCKFLFNSSSAKMQKNISQTVKTCKRRGIVAMKISINAAAQYDAEVVRLAKHDIINTHLNYFYCSMSKAIEKVRELVAKLEANDILSS